MKTLENLKSALIDEVIRREGHESPLTIEILRELENCNNKEEFSLIRDYYYWAADEQNRYA